ncbi:MAG TPA: hypothetical protein PL151_01535 [Phycisphaerae bacterium]|nr:hypothetical protein [Phycisphaerae bacterium]HOM53737.1 hypothetical protein [Phycisphaerae bacterium]HPP29070.1 hypothetical protein [Phycisphaerae bacterium]HQE26413.1 hypothetical protein [Phycisphaerae bacterium]
MAFCLATALCAQATPMQPASTQAESNPLDPLPIREVTVFKDGHAFVLREGRVTVDESGRAVLDD